MNKDQQEFLKYKSSVAVRYNAFLSEAKLNSGHKHTKISNKSKPINRSNGGSYNDRRDY